jgi:hypothetical protein
VGLLRVDSNLRPSGPQSDLLPGVMRAGGPGGQSTRGFSSPLVTVGGRSCPCGSQSAHGPRADRGVRSRTVADASGAPVLRDQGPIGPAGHGKDDAGIERNIRLLVELIIRHARSAWNRGRLSERQGGVGGGCLCWWA